MVNIPNWVKKLDKDYEHPKGISRKSGHVSWNGNSGAAAISMAAHTGASRIILLGFDMNLNDVKYQHWHDVYQKGNQEGNEKLLLKTYATFDKHLRGFPQIALDARRMGIEIINANPTSEIRDFIKVPVNILL
jgi:hypothetical protein